MAITKNNLICKIYNNQKVNSKRRKHPPPNYSRVELRDWLFSQQLFHELYNNWKNNNYISDLKPSLDRKNSYLSYTLKNIQLMTWGENNRKGNIDRKIGINNKNSKAVCQFDKEGIFIKDFFSQSEASRQTGINKTGISSVCRGKGKAAGGYIWKFKQNIKLCGGN